MHPKTRDHCVLQLSSNMIKTIVIFGALVLFGTARAQCPSVTTASGTHAPTGQICSGDLIFEDNFDTLDLKKWAHEQTLGGGGNWEFEWYTNSRYNSYVDAGKLFIKPTLLADENGEDFLYSGELDINGGSPADECTNPQWYGCARTGTPDNALNPIKSARIRSLYSFSFIYGKVEISAKLPNGDWLWPALWMLPRDNQYSGWPASGEIDIMESRGNPNLISAQGQNIGNKLVSSTLHWGPRWDINMYSLTHWEKTNDAGWDQDFHRYQMEWTQDYVRFSIDDQELGTITPPAGGFWELGNLDGTGIDNPWKRNSKMAPFDQEFYIIINLACGGVNSFFPDDATNPGGKPWINTSGTASTDFWKANNVWLPTWNLETDQAALQVDYVRVWAL